MRPCLQLRRRPAGEWAAGGASWRPPGALVSEVKGGVGMSARGTPRSRNTFRASPGPKWSPRLGQTSGSVGSTDPRPPQELLLPPRAEPRAPSRGRWRPPIPPQCRSRAGRWQNEHLWVSLVGGQAHGTQALGPHHFSLTPADPLRGAGVCSGGCPVWLFATPCSVVHQDALSMGFSRQEFWSGLPFPPPGELPDSGIEPRSPALAG